MGTYYFEGKCFIEKKKNFIELTVGKLTPLLQQNAEESTLRCRNIKNILESVKKIKKVTYLPLKTQYKRQ